MVTNWHGTLCDIYLHVIQKEEDLIWRPFQLKGALIYNETFTQVVWSIENQIIATVGEIRREN
jgi:hypothetical protein